jgi:hypothetical protein
MPFHLAVYCGFREATPWYKPSPALKKGYSRTTQQRFLMLGEALIDVVHAGNAIIIEPWIEHFGGNGREESCRKMPPTYGVQPAGVSTTSRRWRSETYAG